MLHTEEFFRFIGSSHFCIRNNCLSRVSDPGGNALARKRSGCTTWLQSCPQAAEPQTQKKAERTDLSAVGRCLAACCSYVGLHFGHSCVEHSTSQDFSGEVCSSGSKTFWYIVQLRSSLRFPWSSGLWVSKSMIFLGFLQVSPRLLAGLQGFSWVPCTSTLKSASSALLLGLMRRPSPLPNCMRCL